MSANAPTMADSAAQERWELAYLLQVEQTVAHDRPVVGVTMLFEDVRSVAHALDLFGKGTVQVDKGDGPA